MPPRRLPIGAFALVIFPLTGNALWALFVSLGEDDLAWMPGAMPLIASLGLPAAGMAWVARGRASPRAGLLLVLGTLAMIFVWFWAIGSMVEALEGRSSEPWYD